MGQGQGLGSARPAWRAVNADGKRPAVGMSRDFPTAKEVAEGKRAAESAAQAQAAQAAAILQNMADEMTHLRDSAHRWDDDEDEDGIIDFGGDLPLHTSAPPRQPPSTTRAPPQPPLDQPVPKSERFAEDFDRSWPRSARQAAAEEAQRPPDLRKRESDRVLFNASSNRLETPSSRPQPPPQPTRLMSRNEVPAAPAPTQASSAVGRDLHRQPPPHMTNPTGPPGRQLPPHMADAAPVRTATLPSQPPARSAWSNTPRDSERALPPHLANKADLPPQSSAFEASRSPPGGPGSALPPRRSFGQATQPATAHPPAPTQSTQTATTQPTQTAAVDDPTETQAAEMHSAAEKARLRREAEEVERKAAAERAKQKARELEARLGLKSAGRSAEPAAENIAAPVPPPVTSTPSYTIAQRPKAPTDEAPAIKSSVGHGATSAATSTRPAAQPARSRDDLWRTRDAPPHQESTVSVPETHPPSHPRTIIARDRPARPTAESFFDQETNDLPPPIAEAGPSTPLPTDAEMQALFQDAVGEQPTKKEYMFDDTLARIKAAMGGSKAPQAAPTEATGPSQDPQARTSAATSSKAVAQPPKAAPPAPRSPLVPQFFNVTQPEIPRSPPPAWRTYVVKLPKQAKETPRIPDSQLSALRRMRLPSRGWLMSFNPPLDLPPQSLSRTDIFLPAPGPRRVARTDSAPLVSISQVGLEPFAKEGKSSASSAPARQTQHRQVESSQTRSGGRWRTTDEPSPAVPEPVSTQVTVDLLDAPPVLPKATTRPAALTPAQSQTGTSRFDPTTIASAKNGPMATAVISAPALAPAPVAAADPKSGVRFMVASEHEGDSLLDEVNKMSLETVEEAGIKDRNLPGSEVVVSCHPVSSTPSRSSVQPPRSPVSHGAPSAPRTHPSSPNGNVSWNTSHEHLKHVWQQTPQQNADLQAASAPSSNTESTSTPLYPSLNAPSTSDPPASQSAATKLSYSSQTFSPTSAAFSSLRQQSPGVGYAASPTSADGMSGLGYPRTQGAVNGYPSMSQQNLWSTPFSTPATAYGAGYASSKAGMDPKAAMAFGAAGGVGANSQYLYGQTGGYSSLPTPHSSYGQYSSQAQVQQQHQHAASRMASSPNGTYNYPAGYTQAQAQQQAANRMSSRFAQSNGAGSPGEYDNAGYYGYVGAGGSGVQPTQAQNHGMYYTSSGSTAVGHGAMHQSRGGQGGQGRKMW